ncbi:MAG: putative metal-dependent hydrolase [Bacteroidota bacterium]
MTIDPRYPIGKYEPQPYSEEQKKKWLFDLQFLPEGIERAILNLDEAQLDTPYRTEGWTVKQVVHHVADSHMNAYIRFKLGLTEDHPVIKPYEEKEWANLSDNFSVPINVSITLLHALHIRWVAAIGNLTEDQWDRKVFHPASKREMTLWFLLGLYAWHCNHHIAHITTLRENRKW